MGVRQRLVVTTATTYEIVADADLSDWCKAPPDDAAEITALRLSAHAYAESYCSQMWGDRAVSIYLPCFPDRHFALAHRPITSVNQVFYYDSSNVEQTLAMEYDPVTQTLWTTGALPATYDRPDAVRIEAQAGHAAAPADVQLAVKLHALAQYDCLDNEAAVHAHLDPHKWR